MQAFVTGVRVLRGEDGAREWLEAFEANEPMRYENNIQILDAVDSGEIALGLINHYYWYERVAEVGAGRTSPRGCTTSRAATRSALVNVAGVGIIAGTDQPGGGPAGRRLPASGRPPSSTSRT